MGQLGSGKTTIILSLVKQIAGDDYKVVWVKNEYGDVNVDGELAKEQGISTEEIMNGCVCCTALGKLEDAINEVLILNPDRIILETAGTAHPAPIALELKRFQNLQIDSFAEVIDCLNFKGFDNHGFIRQSYAKFIDFIILNKLNLISGSQLENILDEVLDIYPDTPRIKSYDGEISSDLLLGLDSNKIALKNIEEIEMDLQKTPDHHDHIQAFSCKLEGEYNTKDIQKICESLSTEDIYRIKGIVNTPDGSIVLNGVASRFNWQPLQNKRQRTELLFIGKGADNTLKNKICEQLNSIKL